MVVMERPAELVLDRVEVVEGLFRAVADDADLVGGALQRAFGAAAIVALDEDDQRVVGEPLAFDGFDHAADVVVVIGEEGGVNLRHVGKKLLLPRVERVPGGHVGRARRQDRILRDHAELLLPRERLLAQLVPALVELALEFRDPILRDMVRGVGRAGGVIGEERLVGRQRVLLLDPVDRLVGEIGVQMVVRLGLSGQLLLGLDRRRVLEQGRVPLVHVAADEPVEIIEAEPGRPEIERPDGAALPGRHVVVLAEPGGAVAVAAQNFGDRAAALRHQRIVARIAEAALHDDAGMRRVLIAPGDERGARRRAQGRRIELVVFDAVRGKRLEGRRRNRAPEHAGGAEADIVGQDQQDVGRALGRRDRLRKVRLGILGRSPDDAFEHRVGVGEHGDVWRAGRDGRRSRLHVGGFCGLRLRKPASASPAYGARERRFGGRRNIWRRFMVLPPVALDIDPQVRSILHGLDRPGERERRLLAIVHRDGRAEVHADVERLGGGEPSGRHVRHIDFARGLAVEEELRRAAGALDEWLEGLLRVVEDDFDVSCRKGNVGDDPIPLPAEEIVFVDDLSALDVERVAGAAAAGGDDHAFGLVVRNDDARGDPVRALVDRRRASLGNAGDARRIVERLSALA